MMLILDIWIMVLIGYMMVASQPRNLNFGYQGITKLAVIGDKVTVECPFTGPFYSWRHFQANADSRVLLDQDSKSIVIDSATTDKTGIYECKSTTGFGKTVANITVKIIDPNSEITKEICSFRKTDLSQDISGGLCFFNDMTQKKTRYKLGNTTELDCEAVGNNLRYTWKFIDSTGIPEKISKSFNITKLIINNINPENEGTYKCEVTNNQALKIYRTFPVVISEGISSEADFEVIGEKLMSFSLKYDANISLVCEIRKNYHNIHSIKWGKRIEDPLSESKLTNNVVSWENHNYRILPPTGIVESHKDQRQVTSTLTVQHVEEINAGIYICLAMNTLGGTVYKLFNITVTHDIFIDNTGKRSQFFFLYILLPAILIFICVCAIIYCCVKSNTAKTSNSMPLKPYNSSTPSNGNKTTTSNYYYPVTTSRSNTNCPPLPQHTEFQAPNTDSSYTGYGNSHYQQSCCILNGV